MGTEDKREFRRKTLLLFLGAGKEPTIDPIRIMKGLFLFAMKAPKDWVPAEGRYHFVAYSFGPCSFDIYGDLDVLSARGLLTATEQAGQTWKYYSLSEAGNAAAEEAAKELDPKIRAYLDQLRQFVERLSFRQLLSVIYKNYPDYAKNSVFNGA